MPEMKASTDLPRTELPQVSNVGRLAMRVEGDWWSAYYALPNTMKGAILLGRVRMAFVQTPERKEAFMGLMREAFGDIIEEKIGMRPAWNSPAAAPEHEKAGRA